MERVGRAVDQDALAGACGDVIWRPVRGFRRVSARHSGGERARWVVVHGPGVTTGTIALATAARCLVLASATASVTLLVTVLSMRPPSFSTDLRRPQLIAGRPCERWRAFAPTVQGTSVARTA